MMRRGVTIRPARLADVPAVAAEMRDWDRRECEALGHGPAETLAISLRASRGDAWLGCLDGVPVMMFGCRNRRSLLVREGQPWALSTRAAEKFDCARALVRYSHMYVKDLQTRYDLLRNRVAADYVRSVRWLERLGFVVTPDVRTVGGVRWAVFYWQKED